MQETVMFYPQNCDLHNLFLKLPKFRTFKKKKKKKYALQKKS